MVDSLTRHFDTCAPKRFQSLEQGYGTYVLTLADSAEAHEVMTRAISLEDLLKKFPSATVLKDIWIAKAHVNHLGKAVIQYISAEFPPRFGCFEQLAHRPVCRCRVAGTVYLG